MSLTIAEFHAESDKLRELRTIYYDRKADAEKAELAYKRQMARVRELADDEGIRGGYRTAEGSYEVPEPTWYATIQDFNAYQKWARENRPALLRLDKRVTDTMNALVRERINNNQPLPPGLGAYPKAPVKVKK